MSKKKGAQIVPLSFKCFSLFIFRLLLPPYLEAMKNEVDFVKDDD